MKNLRVTFLLLFTVASVLCAQGPKGKNLGIGVVFGEPMGATLKYWTDSDNAVVFDLGGNSYYGSVRINVDYLWHTNSFNSQVIKLFFAAGASLGLGDHYGDGFWYRGHSWTTRANMAFGARGLVGLNVIPRNSPVEIYLELGPLLTLSPAVFSTWDAAVGVRFYP